MAKKSRDELQAEAMRRFQAKTNRVKGGASAAPGSTPEGYRALRKIDVAAIEPNPDQPRSEFDEGELEKLAASIAEHGLLQPISVVEVEPGRYLLIAGERRWRAVQKLGREQIEAIVYSPDSAPEDRELMAVIENTNRTDLTPVERAEVVMKLFQDRGLASTPEGLRRLVYRLKKGLADTAIEQEAAKLFDVLGMAPDTFRRKALGTLFWPEELRAGVRNGEFSYAAAEVIAKAKGEAYAELLEAAKKGATPSDLKKALRAKKASRKTIGPIKLQKYYGALKTLRKFAEQLGAGEEDNEVKRLLDRLEKKLNEVAEGEKASSS